MAHDLNSSKRLVNVHQAKTHLSRLMYEAHKGEAILLAKAGRPWARLMPLNPTPALHPEALLEPLSPEELADWVASSLPQAPPLP